MLTVYIDFKSPASYLAMKPVLALAKRSGIKLEWKPFKTVERDVPKLTDKATVGETHRQVRAASRRLIHQKYAKIQGIDLQFPAELTETDFALGALALIEGDPLPFINAAFIAYWIDHQNINDLDVVKNLLVQSGAKLGNDNADIVMAALELAESEAEERGIVDAPAFSIQDQLFIGREHLPWIEEIVSS